MQRFRELLKASIDTAYPERLILLSTGAPTSNRDGPLALLGTQLETQ